MPIDLTVDEARQLILAARDGDSGARLTLITSLLPMARRESYRYLKTLGGDEALSVANLALVASVDDGIRSFDAAIGGGLINYCRRSIRRALRAAYDKKNIVHPPLDMQQ